jgi:DNA-directed RNA polymerase subunit RPC12/RpoP
MESPPQLACPTCGNSQTRCVGKSDRQINDQVVATIYAYKCATCRAVFTRTKFPGGLPPLDELLDDRD